MNSAPAWTCTRKPTREKETADRERQYDIPREAEQSRRTYLVTVEIPVLLEVAGRAARAQVARRLVEAERLVEAVLADEGIQRLWCRRRE